MMSDREFVNNITGPADDAALDRLRAQLAERADSDGLLDVAYRTMDSPIGPLLLAATPAGLVRVAFECEGHDDVLAELSTAISPRILRSSQRVDDVARRLGHLRVVLEPPAIPGPARLAIASHVEAMVRDFEAVDDAVVGHALAHHGVLVHPGSPDALAVPRDDLDWLRTEATANDGRAAHLFDPDR